MSGHGGSRLGLFVTACAAALAIAAVSGCSGGSGHDSSTAAPATSAASPTDPAIQGPTAPPPTATDDGGPAAAPTFAQTGTGDRKVTAVFQPAGHVSDARFADFTELGKARAALITGTVVTVTSGSGAITVVGDTTQLAAIKALGRKSTVSFRPVVYADADGTSLPAPTDTGEASAEILFQAVACEDQGSLPATAAAADYGVGCTDQGVRVLLGPAGAMGTDVSSATAKKNGQAGWEVDIAFTASGTQGIAAMTGTLARNLGSMALEWDDQVPVAMPIRAPVTTGAAQISGLTEAAAKRLAAILSLGAVGASLTTSSVSIRS
jgi:hypothetical protein